jgi:DNA-binding response OmpR family regulator
MPVRQRRRVVIVDTDPRLLNVAERYLRTAGYDIVTVADPGAGLQAVIDRQSDLVILDMTTLGAAGVEAFQRSIIRTSGEAIPVVLVTVRNRTQIEDARNTGVDQFLMKPFTLSSLERAIRDLIGGPDMRGGSPRHNASPEE